MSLVQKYLRSLSGILLLLGIMLLIISSIWDWHSFIENIGLTLSVSGVTMFLYKTEILDIVKENKINKLSISGIDYGRDFFLKTQSDIDNFFTNNKTKIINICGISMYSFFNPNNLYVKLIEYASLDYKIKIIFANPESQELSYQEEVEEKPGFLKEHIKLSVQQFRKEIIKRGKEEKVFDNIEIYFSKTVPRVFIFGNSNKMVVTQYGLRGPFNSPTMLLTKAGENSLYYAYADYFNDLIENAIRKVELKEYVS